MLNFRHKVGNLVAAVVTARAVRPPLHHLYPLLASGNPPFHPFQTPSNPTPTSDRGDRHLAWGQAEERTLTLTTNSNISRSGKWAMESRQATWQPTPFSVRRQGPGSEVWAVGVCPRVAEVQTSARSSRNRRDPVTGSWNQAVRTCSYLLLPAVEVAYWVERSEVVLWLFPHLQDPQWDHTWGLSSHSEGRQSYSPCLGPRQAHPQEVEPHASSTDTPPLEVSPVLGWQGERQEVRIVFLFTSSVSLGWLNNL